MRHQGSQLKQKLRTGVRALLGVGDDESLQSFVEQRGATLRRRGTHALRKVEQVLQGLGIAPPPGPRGADGSGAARDGASASVPRPEQTKFDLGQGIDRTPPREHIPWGYGEDRVTAMPVDPERLYVYWEVTDSAIASARAGLGNGGADAWLSLRVYDVTGRIFDGTNAHGYFDHRVERHDRQWFFSIGKPGSSVIVELGLKSHEGYFVRIARSGRVDFPRTTPAPARAVEWMTVRAFSGDVEPSWHTPPPAASESASARHAARRAAAGAGADPSRAQGAERVRVDDLPAALREAARGERTWEWSETLPEGFHELATNGAWVGGVERSSWEAGPFPHPVEAPGRVVEEERPGYVRVEATPRGTRVVYGPWQVTLRGIGARAERKVLARWEITRTWSSGGVEPVPEPVWAPVAPGASELALRRGASERRFGAASELRLGGASEVFYLGASELRRRGASERLYAGASERRWLGASERVARGASESRYAGGSERLHAGASERRVGGASERLRSARESWEAFASEGARLVAGKGGAPGAGSERRLANGATTGRTEPRANGDAASDDDERPQPPRW